MIKISITIFIACTYLFGCSNTNKAKVEFYKDVSYSPDTIKNEEEFFAGINPPDKRVWQLLAEVYKEKNKNHFYSILKNISINDCYSFIDTKYPVYGFVAMPHRLITVNDDSAHASIIVIDMRGRLVSLVLSEVLPRGKYGISYEYKDKNGEFIKSGEYEFIMKVGEDIIERRKFNHTNYYEWYYDE